MKWVPRRSRAWRQAPAGPGREAAAPPLRDTLLVRFGGVLFVLGTPLLADAVARRGLPAGETAGCMLLSAAVAAATWTRRVALQARGAGFVIGLLLAGALVAREAGPSPGGVLCLALATALATVVFFGRGGGVALGFLLLGGCVSTPRWTAEPPHAETWAMAASSLLGTGLLVLLVGSVVQRTEESLTEVRTALAAAVRHQQARTMAEAALRESEARLLDALAAAHAGTWDWDVASGAVFWTGPAALLGVACGSSATIDSFRATVAPDDRAAVEQAIERVLSGETDEYCCEHRVQGTDPPRWVEGKGRVWRDAAGRAVRLRGTITDISSRKRAEQALCASEAELVALFAAMRDVILVLDADGRYLRIAPSSPGLLFRPSQELLGRRLRDVLPAPQAEAFLAQIERCLETRQTLAYEYVLEIEGAPTWFSAAVSPMPGDRVLWVARDITESKHLEREFRRRERLAAIGTLVAGVAHEVRTPLFSLSATLDALEAGAGTTDEQHELKALLRSQLDRLSHLMRDLLDFGREPRLRCTRSSVASALRPALRSCQPLAQQSGVTLALELAPGLPELELDLERLEQVFENLITNALQHSPRGAHVRVSAGRCDGAPGRVCCSVEDMGAGIASADLEHVFEPFFSRRRGGTGLGLPIAQRFVEAHGGSLSATNRPQGGAVFHVLLPVDPAPGGA